jgi:hypothetical protein
LSGAVCRCIARDRFGHHDNVHSMNRARKCAT